MSSEKPDSSPSTDTGASTGPGLPGPDTSEQERVRRDKVDRIRATGGDPYPRGYLRTTTVADLRATWAELAPETSTGSVVSITGRVVLKRDSGRLLFATLQESGERIQLMVAADAVGAERLADWKADVDLGDLVGVTGEVVTSRRGELSVRATSWALTGKALRPLPDKHKGLADPEARVRMRYVDLIVNPDARRLLLARDTILASLRATLRERGYIEVETPVLQAVHGGAAARPFTTHMNAFDRDYSLRIALELSLKRLLVGDVERVFEIGRIFRNEGVDSTHSPEFTMLEAYEAYGDYDTMAELTQALVRDAALALGVTTVPDGAGGEIDLMADWRHATVHDLVSEAIGETVDPGTDAAALRAHAKRLDVELRPQWGAGDIVLELYEKLVEHSLLEPTFVRDYPVEVRPLARPHRDDPRLSEAWDLIIAGRELSPAYSELTDPVEQRRRLTEQSLLAAGGDPEAMQLDEDFLRALEHAMPPTGGMGLGVDRLIMLLTGTAGIRETITFPLLRPGSAGV